MRKAPPPSILLGEVHGRSLAEMKDFVGEVGAQVRMFGFGTAGSSPVVWRT